MKVLFDTNVVLDVLLDREPFSQSAAELFAHVESNQIEGYLGATTITTVFYLASKVAGADRARQEIHRLLTLFSVAPVNRAVLMAALDPGMTDYEDAVLYQAALQVHAEVIVTRDLQGFAKAPDIRILSPLELNETLRQLNARS